MRDSLIAYLTGLALRVYSLAGWRSAALANGRPWFLVRELLLLLPLVGFAVAIVFASAPPHLLHRGYGWAYLFVALIAVTAVTYAQYMRRALINAGIVRIGSASDGYVEIRGEARPLPRTMALRTPRSGEVALWYDYRQSKRRNLSDAWYTEQSDTSSTPFVIADGSGQCMVLPDGLAITGAHELRGASGFESHEERWIAPGDYVFAAGEFRTVQLRDLPLALRLRLPEAEAFQVLAAPANGRPFLIGNKVERGEQLFYRAASHVNLVFLLLALALGIMILRFGQGA